MTIIYNDGGSLACYEKIEFSGDSVIADDIYIIPLDDIREIIPGVDVPF